MSEKKKYAMVFLVMLLFVLSNVVLYAAFSLGAATIDIKLWDKDARGIYGALFGLMNLLIIIAPIIYFDINQNEN